MSERISHSNADGVFVSSISRTDRLHGAALGCGGSLITLALGGAVMWMVRLLLTVGPGGGEVEHRVLIHLWQFFHGIWLVVPAAIAGTIIGYDRLLTFFSHIWFTADPRRKWLSLGLWIALALVCKLTGLVFAFAEV